MSDDDDSDEYEGGESWADILARGSPEGAAVVAELDRAERTALDIQQRIIKAIREHRDYTDDFAAFEESGKEIERLRSKVYRMVRQ